MTASADGLESGRAATQQLTVVVRVRPMNSNEKERRYFQCVFPLDKKRILLVDPEKYSGNILRQNRQHERQFAFDAAFGPNSSQDEVHAATTAPLVDYVVAGYNATIFAYGATGSGKTYTMIGTKEQPGLMTLLTQALYEKLSDDDTVHLSYLEVYNEVIRDLLNPSASMLELMEDDKGNVRVPGLSTVRAPNISRIMQILQEGNLRRTQEATDANKTSSRSHALLQVSLQRRNKHHGKLFLIDLAGSERASNTNNKGQRLKEGAAINRSLLALGNVINSLSSGKKAYVNYRDSKLTRLLKDSLGGNARTCMIAHVTAASGHFEETYNTLVYASRAKNITTKPTRNRPSSADQPYTEALREMRKEVDRRSLISHAVSANHITEKSGSEQRVKWNSPGALTNGKKAGTGSESRQALSLFTQLKEQYMTTSDKQKKLRERLMRANEECYETDMNRTAKIAILNAWERQKNIGEKTAESIDRLKSDVGALDERLSQLVEVRRKTEKAIRKNDDAQRSLESRLRGQAATREQKELANLIVRMSEIEAEKISVTNDLAIHDIIMKKTDNSMAKLQKYESLADRLIEGQVEDADRERLEQEYRIVKNQFHYHLIPLKNIHSTVSWNSELLPPIVSASSSDSPLDQTYVLPRKKRHRESMPQLPAIQRSASHEKMDSGSESG